MFYLLLEILRIILLLLIFVGFFISLLGYSYSFLGFNLNNFHYAWLAYIAIISLFFVLYRNKLQYSGWYIGKRRERLSKTTTLILVASSILLMIITPLLNSLGDCSDNRQPIFISKSDTRKSNNLSIWTHGYSKSIHYSKSVESAY